MRNVKKILPRILILVVFVAALNSGVRYLYEPPTRNGIYTVNEIKETKGEVETLVLGSSLAHWGVDGNLLGEMLDSLTLNLATSAQPLIGSYYFLKEQSQINPIQRVFLGLHATTMLRDNNKALDVRQWIFDRLVTPLGKLDYLVHTADFTELEQYLLYATRIDNLFNIDMVKENVTYKRGEDYQNNIPPEDEDMTYYGMGNENTDEVYDGSYDKEKVGKGEYWDRDNVLDISVEYLEKIALLCQERGIELNIFITPLTFEYASIIGDLDDLNQYFQEFCSAYGANLYDAGQIENVYDLFSNEYFQDYKHLNRTGSELFTSMMGEWYLGLEAES